MFDDVYIKFLFFLYVVLLSLKHEVEIGKRVKIFCKIRIHASEIT